MPVKRIVNCSTHILSAVPIVATILVYLTVMPAVWTWLGGAVARLTLTDSQLGKIWFLLTAIRSRNCSLQFKSILVGGESRFYNWTEFELQS